MRRRDFIFQGAVAMAWALGAQAQQRAKLARIAWLGYSSMADAGFILVAFKQGLRELGYVEGKDVVFDVRWAAGRTERLDELAKELVALKPDVILATTTVTGRAALRATTTIPIVVASSSDPVGGGLAKNLARPGGNVTGLSNLGGDVSPKLLEFLRAVVPKLSTAWVLLNPYNPTNASTLKNLRAAAQKMGVKIVVVEAETPAQIEAAFATMAREHAKALLVLVDPMILAHRDRLAELAIRNRLPSLFGVRENVEAGGLMSYGQNLADQFKRAATYVDRILKGANPGEMPIEQATTFELVVNLRTAKALGITIPQSLLFRANRVIE